ncbi:hypothetical protein M6B38_410500 [Iris pallida]|uniref:Uncharacterized protein n=1 Tax=Iris pallida TaxID=29817 RepID=A0AAX6FNY6_IRIPA|nr:hypothetical protein M6B38_410500 [Iris pallida]
MTMAEEQQDRSSQHTSSHIFLPEPRTLVSTDDSDSDSADDYLYFLSSPGHHYDEFCKRRRLRLYCGSPAHQVRDCSETADHTALGRIRGAPGLQQGNRLSRFSTRMEHYRNDQPTSGQLNKLKQFQSRRNTKDRLKTEGFSCMVGASHDS